MNTDLRTAIERSPMTRFQIHAVLICMTLNLIDGFDVLAIAFAAPLLADDWQLAPEQLGLLFSSGLAGMTAGSLLIAPLADVLGRRWMAVASLVLVTAGMIASAFTQNHLQLAGTRVLTGLGIGAMLPSIATIAAEYSSAQRREMALSIMSTGYPIGATLGGSAVILIIAVFGWRGIFVFGGLLSLAMIPIVLWRLPESLAFLIARRPRDALGKANALLGHLGHVPLDALPEPVRTDSESRPRDILAGGLRARTGLLWTAFFCVMFTFYFVVSWTPKLLVDAGLPTDQGISGGVLVNVGGIVGALSLGVLTVRFNIFKLHTAALVLSAATITLFGLMSGALELALTLALLVGFFLFASMVALYAITPSIYPTEVRNTGTGLAVGVGRFGAILSPYLAGLLLGAGWPADRAYIVFSVPMLIAAAAIVLLYRRGTPAAKAMAPTAEAPGT